MNKLLKALLFGMFARMSITPEEGGGLSDEDKAAKVEADRLAAEEKARKDAEDLKNGKKPNDEEAKLLKEVMEKKAALKLAAEKISNLESEIKKFEGIDVAKVKELLKQKEDAERTELEKKGEWETLKKQMADAHSAELLKRDDSNKTIFLENTGLKQQIADLTIGSAFNSSLFVTEELTLTPVKARILYGAHFEFKDGKVVAFDKPAGAAGRAPLVDGNGEPVSFEDAITKIIKADPEHDRLMKAKGKPGAGSNTRAGARNDDSSKDKKLSGIDKIAAGLEAMRADKD